MSLTAPFHKHSPFWSNGDRPRRCLQQFRQVWEPRLVRGDEYHWCSHNTSGNISWSEEMHTAWLLSSVMSAGSEEQRAVRVLARGEQLHLRSPVTLSVPNHPNRLGVQSPLSLRNPLARKHVRPSDQETGDVRCSDEEDDSPLPACTAPLSEFLPGDLYTKPLTCCRCESVHAAVPAVAEKPLELRRLLPAPGGLCATGS